MDGLNRLDTAEERFSKLEDKAEEVTRIAAQKEMKIKSKETENRVRGCNMLAYVERPKKIIEITRERQYLRK